jgi:hypothetical protein
LPVDAGRRPRHDHDLAIAAGDLDAIGDVIAGGVEVRAHGSVGSIDLVRRSRRVHTAPAAVPDLVVPLDPVRTRDATLVVVDPGARLELTAPLRRFQRHEAVVIECPAVNAGACEATRVAELDLGVRLAMVPNGALRLWNNGPGPLVLVVRATRALRPGDRGPAVHTLAVSAEG